MLCIFHGLHPFPSLVKHVSEAVAAATVELFYYLWRDAENGLNAEEFLGAYLSLLLCSPDPLLHLLTYRLPLITQDLPSAPQTLILALQRTAATSPDPHLRQVFLNRSQLIIELP